jgi:hypothetical protein
MVVAKQIANSALGRQHKNSLERSDVNIAYSQSPIANSPKLHSIPYINKHFEKTIEHIIPLSPAPCSRQFLRIRADCGC